MKKQVKKYITFKGANILFASSIILFGLIAFGSLFAPDNTSALTYQENVPVQFTFEPVLSINLSSSDLVISDLAPGTSSDSNEITVGVSTNTLYGYTLSATVGAKNGTSSLNNSTNSSYKFNNLASAVSTLANIPDNNWGYSYSSDNGSTWVSGDTGSTTTGYAGLPLDNNDNATDRGQGGVLLINNDGTSNINSVKFKIGAKASSAQPSGEYTNVVNFYAVANPAPEGVTDLTDTTWYFDAQPSSPPASTTNYSISFTFDNKNATSITLYQSGVIEYGYSDGQNHYGYSLFGNSGWGKYDDLELEWTLNSNLRTIHITGGTDATNTDLINYLESNATQL